MPLPGSCGIWGTRFTPAVLQASRALPAGAEIKPSLVATVVQSPIISGSIVSRMEFELLAKAFLISSLQRSHSSIWPHIPCQSSKPLCYHLPLLRSHIPGPSEPNLAFRNEPRFHFLLLPPGCFYSCHPF